MLRDLIDVGLTVKVEKCAFGFSEVMIVGHKCSAEGRGMEETKVTAIMNWRPCRNLTEVKSFLGLVGFYMQWIKDFL